MIQIIWFVEVLSQTIYDLLQILEDVLPLIHKSFFSCVTINYLDRSLVGIVRSNCLVS